MKVTMSLYETNLELTLMSIVDDETIYIKAKKVVHLTKISKEHSSGCIQLSETGPVYMGACVRVAGSRGLHAGQLGGLAGVSKASQGSQVGLYLQT